MKNLPIHGAVAVIALVAAYGAWTHKRKSGESSQDSAEQSEIVVAEIQRHELTGLTYETEDKVVSVNLDKQESPYWLTVTTKTKIRNKRPPQAKKADAGAADTPPDLTGDGDAGVLSDGAAASKATPGKQTAPAYREDVIRFAANDVFDEILAKLAPLKAVRRLGKIQENRLEDFELHEPKSTLTLNLKRGPRVLNVGGRTFGGGDHYVLDEQNGEVYLLESKLIRDLNMARTRLIQRDLHRFDISEAVSVKVSSGDRQIVIEHRNRLNERDATWSPAQGTKGSGELHTNWMQQLSRLRALSYLKEDEIPAEAGSSMLMRLEYLDVKGDSLGFIQIIRRGSESSDYLGKSEATGSWVRISHTLAEQLIDDLEEVLAGQSS